VIPVIVRRFQWVVAKDSHGGQNWGLTDFPVTDPDGYYLRFTGRAS